MRKIIKLTESDLEMIVKKVLKEQTGVGLTSFGIPNLSGVKGVQQALINKGFSVGPKGVDGNFGPKTKDAVIQYQKANGIKPTGNVGPITAKSLGVQPLTGKSSKPSETKSNSTSKSSAIKNVAKCETGTDAVLNPNASLSFDGDKLYWLADGKVIKSWDSVSGLTWKNTPTKDWGEMLKRYTSNRETWSKDKNAGPLPEGTYSVGPLESRSGNQEEIGALEAFWYKLTGSASNMDTDKQFCKNTIISRIAWGNYRAAIKPTGNQKMYGRDSFYIHGGALSGSHGCIDMTDNMEDFAKFFGIWTSLTKKKLIPLTVKYKNPLINRVIQKLVNLV